MFTLSTLYKGWTIEGVKKFHMKVKGTKRCSCYHIRHKLYDYGVPQ